MNNHLNTIHATMCEKVIIMRVGLRSGGWGCAGSAESDALESFNNASLVRTVFRWVVLFSQQLQKRYLSSV